MTFESILFDRSEDRRRAEQAIEPDYFTDLNLDQMFAGVISGKDGYDLAPFFRMPLGRRGSVAYRQAVMRDVEKGGVLAALNTFTKDMCTVRECLETTDRLRYERQKHRWFLDAADTYCRAVTGLAAALSGLHLASKGLQSFRHYLQHYIACDAFADLADTVAARKKDLSQVRYLILVRGGDVTVRLYDGEDDYTKQVEKTFAKFRQGTPKNYLVKFPETVEMNHIEAAIIEHVAQLEPGVFARLEAFFHEYRDFEAQEIAGFDREIQFYIAYLEFIEPLKRVGLQFCYPDIAVAGKDIFAHSGFDLALAAKLLKEERDIVCNDFALAGHERIIVVSGPNQGGKTTFARSIGQLHHLAALGLPVPARKARLLLFDQLFTHFEREEELANLRGKLKDDLVRIHDILSRATSQSVVVMNEIFNSTSAEDALFLSNRIIRRIVALDTICVCVTFIDEITQMSDTVVSMVGVVAPHNPAERTFRIERRPADGLAYAISVAEKYRLTYDMLKKRIRS